MKKFIITEEDRKHIKGLYEQADPNAQAYNDLAGKELIKLYPNKEYLTQTADVISKRLDNETRTDNYIASSGEEVVGSGMNPNLLPYIKQLIQTNSGGKIKFSNTPTVSTKTQGATGNVNNLPSLGPDQLSSKYAEITKQQKEFFNKKYPGTNLSVDGNWLDKKFNDTMAKYITEKGGTPSYCKKGDGYCGEGQDGVVYISDRKIADTLKQEISGGETPQNSNPQQPIAGEKINTTNDKAYDYKLANGKYFYSKKGLNKWIEAKGKGLESIKTKVKF